MNGAQRELMLLTCTMGDPARKVLTASQQRTLAARTAELSGIPGEESLLGLGYRQELARRIEGLLAEQARLDSYLAQGQSLGCLPLVRSQGGYPGLLTRRLGWEAPGCLWAMGDLSMLGRAAISLVGSRNLREENWEFARAVGILAAQLGMPLVSGNARGADRTAQDACLEAGGQVISIVADELCRQTPREGVLYLSEDCFDGRFSARRALSRNRSIHALGTRVFVAQSDWGKGGTWSGTTQNLRYGWSPVLCFRDGSQAVEELVKLGAGTVSMEELAKFQTV